MSAWKLANRDTMLKVRERHSAASYSLTLIFTTEDDITYLQLRLGRDNWRLLLSSS